MGFVFQKPNKKSFLNLNLKKIINLKLFWTALENNFKNRKYNY